MNGRKQTRLVVFFCAIACVLGVILPVQAQVSFPAHPRYTVERLPEQFGLGAVTVTVMAQDREGFLWIGTQTGLYRYDGARAEAMAEVEPIIGHYVLDIVVAPDGTPWFAGNRGVAHYFGGKFESLPIPPSAMPLENGTQMLAVDSKGTAYVLLFRHGILRANPNDPSKTQVLGEPTGVDKTVAGIARSEDDSIWFTFGGHLAHIARGSTEVEVDRKTQLPRGRVSGLLWDGQHRLWLRTATRLARLDPTTHQAVYESAVVGPADNVEGKPTLDRRGRLLVPSSTGLYWQGHEGQWTVITDKQGITSNQIQFAMEDREGTLWIAGSGTGLDLLPGVREWSGWTVGEGLLDNTTWSTQRDHQGRLWVSTSRGIAVWDGHRWAKIPSGEGNKNQFRELQVAGDGSVWASTATGALIRFDPTDFSSTRYAGFHGRMFGAEEVSPDGKVWAITDSHLVWFDGKRRSAEPADVPMPLVQGGSLLCLSVARDGTIWTAGTDAAYRFDGRNWTTFTGRDGLLGREITSVSAVSGNEAWVGYNDVVGVTRILVSAAGQPQMEHHHWDLFVIGQDAKGREWFDGPGGLAVLAADGTLRHISHTDGLLWDDVSPWEGVREEKDGSYLIATSRGLARYRPESTSEGATQPNTTITFAALGGKRYQIQETPKVKPQDGTLTVQFTPMVLKDPRRVSCAYQLKGLEKAPTNTQQREVQYGGLPPGEYEFRVQCESPGGAGAGTTAGFRFEVLPNFWQTRWAQALGGVLLLGVLWSVVWLRTRRLNRRQLELEEAVAQRNAELLQKNKELQEISLTDPLTGTRNRRYFYETISKDVAQTVRAHVRNLGSNRTPGPSQDLIFALVDIDRFKRVNDELGHDAGDRLLREMAKRIASVMRQTDDLVRWGGEEFLLVCRTTDRENASLLFKRVLEAVRELPFDVGNGVDIHKTCSIGWAPYPWLKDQVALLSVNNVIELADKALYLAKREGRNRVYGFLPAEEASRSQRSVSIENLRDFPPDLVQIV